MIAHVTSSALVSENKTYCHPASVDSIPTAANYEDHVSMGGWAARKALKLLDNVEIVLAIELLAACQAIDLRQPLKSTPILEAVKDVVRQNVAFIEEDRVISDEIQRIGSIIREGKVWKVAEKHIANYLD